MKNEEIVRRFSAAVQDRKVLDGTFEVIEQFVVPFRGEYFNEQQNELSVEWRRRKIFDSTAIDSCQTLAASLQGSLTSMSTIWFTLGFEDQELNDDYDASTWIEECQDIMWNELQNSNFNTESSEFYLDLSSLGTSILINEAASEVEWNGFEFSASPMEDTYFEEDSSGQVNVFYRRYKWNARQIVDKFINVPKSIGEAAAKLPDEITSKAESGGEIEKFEVIYCIYPRPDKMHNKGAGILGPSERPYGAKWVLRKDGTQLGYTGGKYEMPAYIARWKKVSGSKYGHSPAFVCLSDILSANELTEQTFEALGKVIDPTTFVTRRGLLSDLDLGRGGITVVRSKDDAWAYESKARFDVGELKLDRLQASIRKAFFVDQLELKETPAMTATEASIRYELIQRLLGPVLGRLQNDYLDPLIARCFNLLARAGRLPEPPEIIAESEAKYKVHYIGPLPRAQRMQTVEAIQQYIGGIAGLVEVFPEAKDIPNVDDMMREIASASGVPTRLNNSKTKVDELRKDRKEKQDRMQNAEIAKNEGEAATAMADGASSLQLVGGQNGG